MRYWILDAAGEPVPTDDVTVWAAWFETAAADRVIARDKDEAAGPGGVLVSTVFLGLNHQWGDGPPVLWETLVFGGALDGEMNRYTSRAAALAGHAAMCARVAEVGPFTPGSH